MRRLLFAIGHWLLVVLLTGCGANQTNGPITALGFIEGKEVSVVSEVSGRIVEITVDRGESVKAGQVLVRLDDTVLQSQRWQAEAALAAARANLARVQAGARPEAIAAARAALAQAEAGRDGALKAVLDARRVINNPLELNAQIDAARTQVRLSEQNVEMARANLVEMELRRSVYAGQGGDVKRGWDLQLRAAEAALAQAQAELDGARAYLDALLEIRANPLTLHAQLRAAEARYRQAEAEVAIAQAALDELEAGPTPEEVAVAKAQVRQAEAAVQMVDAQIAQLVLTAPIDGIVATRSARVGEMATAGQPLLTIANLDELTLVIYVPVNRVGQVRVGQEVEVRVDSFPNRIFIGQVASIAGEAEFTPRHVQTEEERAHLVFAVKVRIPNPDHALKPGMLADAVIR